MIRDTGEISGYFQSVAASYGLEAHVQRFGYAVFFNQRGMMGGISLQSSNNIRIHPHPSVEIGIFKWMWDAVLHRRPAFQ